MSNYGHYNAQYYGNKIDFPKESFLIAGISFYQKNLENINFESQLILKAEPTNKYDKEAIQILFDNKCIGYVPKNNYCKKICQDNINNYLKIINIKRETDKSNFGIRVILDKYYTEDLKDLAIL